MDSKYEDEPPSAKVLEEGYNQTYIILTRDEKAASEVGHEVLFRCGNWCYKGLVQFNDLNINLEEVPLVIPTLQKQQGSLRYFCTAKSVPPSSEYHGPMQFMEEALNFLARELTCDEVERELAKMSNVFPWIEDESAATYFELSIPSPPAFLDRVRLVASKTYARGLIVITLYFASALYCVILSGEGDQPLLDVRFPDLSRHNQGVMLRSYSGRLFGKLTLWHALSAFTSASTAPAGADSKGATVLKRELPRLKTLDLSSVRYEQTYVILRSAGGAGTAVGGAGAGAETSSSMYHDVMFRFGSWCYAGRVQLTAQLSLQDLPYLIPALRMQQSRLDYVCDVTALPVTSPFAEILSYLHPLGEAVERLLLGNEEEVLLVLRKHYGDISSNANEGDDEDYYDTREAFFEFSLALPIELQRKFDGVEMVVSKVYHPSGIITISAFFQGAVFVSLQGTNSSEHPLLDSRFPFFLYTSPASVSSDEVRSEGEAVGYTLQRWERGLPSWPALRRLTLWLPRVSSPSPNPPDLLQERVAEDKTIGEVKKDENENDGKYGNFPDASPVAEVVRVAESKDTKVGVSSPSHGYKQALPHHLPRLENAQLSQRLETIRAAMGDEGLRAPWDLKGRPLSLGPPRESK
eukprot:gene10755-11954_t